MDTLILKLNATRDVVRPPRCCTGCRATSLGSPPPNNVVLLESVSPNVRCVSWENRAGALDRCYDLVISLEDEA